ncbi:hypothetical protein CCH79_00018362 [Gambusia affinis]|uniref:EGF-like domain-containing protein n=1 Tax=Gambusia affinis TaxID=33528 RepID=A0A315V963_GAMAF|nr:hypothetical protein CCH79_00018362 [Gambusia affinis]
MKEFIHQSVRESLLAGPLDTSDSVSHSKLFGSTQCSPRCFPPCRNGSSCGLPNNCLCRRGFYGVRCQFSKVPLPVGRPPETSSHPASSTTAAGPIGSSRKPEPTGSFQKPLNGNDSGPLKSGRLAGQAEGVKGDPGDVTLWFLNQTSPGSTNLMRTDPDPERQSSDSKHVLESKPQTNRENRNPLRSESLELQASLEVKEDEDPTGAERRPEEMKRQIPSLREAQSVLLRNSLSQGGRGGNMAALLMKHITKEKRKLHTLASSSSSSSSSPTTRRAFQNQRGRFDSHLAAPKAAELQQQQTMMAAGAVTRGNGSHRPTGNISWSSGSVSDGSGAGKSCPFKALCARLLASHQHSQRPAKALENGWTPTGLKQGSTCETDSSLGGPEGPSKAPVGQRTTVFG